MGRTTYRQCKLCGEFHDVAAWPDNHREPEPQRSTLAVPMFVRDDMSAVEHPHDGKEYTSKSAFRRVTRQNGYVEVGNDPQRFKRHSKPKPDRKAIRDSLQKAQARISA